MHEWRENVTAKEKRAQKRRNPLFNVRFARTCSTKTLTLIALHSMPSAQAKARAAAKKNRGKPASNTPGLQRTCSSPNFILITNTPLAAAAAAEEDDAVEGDDQETATQTPADPSPAPADDAAPADGECFRVLIRIISCLTLP